MSSNKKNSSLDRKRKQSGATVAHSSSGYVSEEEIKLIGVSTSLLLNPLDSSTKHSGTNPPEISRKHKEKRVRKSTEAPKKSANRPSFETSGDLVANQENVENKSNARKRKSRDSDSESPSKRQRVASPASNKKIDMPRFVASKILALLPPDQEQLSPGRPPLVELLPRATDSKLGQSTALSASAFTKEVERNMERLSATKAAWAFMVQSAGLKTFITPPDSEDSQSDDDSYSPSVAGGESPQNQRGVRKSRINENEDSHPLQSSEMDQKCDSNQDGRLCETRVNRNADVKAEPVEQPKADPVMPTTTSLSLMPPIPLRGWLSNLCELADAKAMAMKRSNTKPEEEEIHSLVLENFAGPGFELSVYGFEGPMSRYGLPEGNEGYIRSTSTEKRM